VTHTTLIGLLTATGLRPGEALALNNSDVDLNNGILSIRQSKFGKSRFVPLADSTRAALVKYAKQRDKLCLHPRSEAFLISERGQRLQGCAARRTFARISCTVGVRPATGTRRIGRGPGFRIFVTVSPRGSSSNGIAPALMLGVNCRSSPHTWGMWMSATPTGFSKPFRSYFNWPPTAWERTGSEINSEHLQLSVSGSAILHRPFANTDWGRVHTLSRHTGTPFVCCSGSPQRIFDARHPNYGRKISMRPSWGSSWKTLSSHAVTAPERATIA